jgi:tripartite-type tricarboxylate transporter receptor subunit TctC
MTRANGWLFAALCTAALQAHAQQPYPSRPVRVITPNAPGGSSDVLARMIGQKLTEGWGQQVVVDNRPGGNGFIGGDALARAPADGYTLMVISPTHIITPLLLRAPYDPIKSFAPVASIGSTAFLLVVHPSLPVATLQDLIRLARSKPGALNYASAGGGSPAHLATALFNMVAGVSMQHVPYKGGGPALTATISGEAQLYFAIPIATIGHVKSGRLRPIAIGAEARLPSLPQVPTFTEGGLSAFDIRIWYGVLAPAGTPRPVLDTIVGEVERHLAAPEIRKRFADEAMTPLTLGPDQFGALMRTDSAKYAKVIKSGNITVE